MDKFLVFRHTDYDTSLGPRGGLTIEGIQQAQLLRKQIRKIYSSLGSTTLLRSDTKRAEEMFQRLELSAGTPIIMKSLFKGSWANISSDIETLRELLLDIARHCDTELLATAIVIGHGNAPFALVRTALEQSGNAIPKELQGAEFKQPSLGHGYLLNVTAGQVFTVSPTGISDQPLE